MESDRPRTGLHRHRADFGALYADHLYDVCHQNGSLAAESAGRISRSVYSQADSQLSGSARCERSRRAAKLVGFYLLNKMGKLPLRDWRSPTGTPKKRSPQMYTSPPATFQVSSGCCRQEWRKWKEFDNIYKLEAVPVVTVQLRFDGWVTEMQGRTAATAAQSCCRNR